MFDLAHRLGVLEERDVDGIVFESLGFMEGDDLYRVGRGAVAVQGLGGEGHEAAQVALS